MPAQGSEKLPDGSTYYWDIPDPPTWAKDDPELWEATKNENALKNKEKAFQAHMAARSQEKLEEYRDLENSFKVFDADGSGFLDNAEVLQILTRAGGGHPMSDQDAKEFIELFDHNGDGKMDVKECESPATLALDSRLFARAARHGTHPTRPTRLPCVAVIDAMKAMAGAAGMDNREDAEIVAGILEDGSLADTVEVRMPMCNTCAGAGLHTRRASPGA